MEITLFSGHQGLRLESDTNAAYGFTRKWERSQMYHIEDHKVGECYYKVRIVRKMSLHRKKTQLFLFAKKDFNSVTQAIYHICLEIAIPVLHYA